MCGASRLRLCFCSEAASDFQPVVLNVLSVLILAGVISVTLIPDIVGLRPESVVSALTVPNGLAVLWP